MTLYVYPRHYTPGLLAALVTAIACMGGRAVYNPAQSITLPKPHWRRPAAPAVTALAGARAGVRPVHNPNKP